MHIHFNMHNLFMVNLSSARYTIHSIADAAFSMLQKYLDINLSHTSHHCLTRESCQAILHTALYRTLYCTLQSAICKRCYI